MLNGIVVVSDSRSGDGWYRSLVASSADAMALLDGDGEILFATPPIERLTGYRPVELIGMSAFDLIHPDDLASVRESFQRVLRSNEPVRIEYRGRHKDGSWQRRDCVAINRLDDRAVGAVVVNYRDTSAGSIADATLLDETYSLTGAINVASTARPHGHETILVVEDQPEVLTVVHYALSRYGYRVLTAADGTEALAVAMTRDEPIDLLITDVVMPGVSARELVDRFRDYHPRAGVIYMSGHTNENVVQRGILEDTVAFLQKPFTPADLMTKVRQVLGEPR